MRNSGITYEKIYSALYATPQKAFFKFFNLDTYIGKLKKEIENPRVPFSGSKGAFGWKKRMLKILIGCPFILRAKRC